MNDDKWFYIKIISKNSSEYGDKLIAMMEEYHKDCLANITLEEAKSFCEKMQKGEI